MRYTFRIIAICILGMLGAGIQISIIAPIAPALPFDLLSIGALSLVLYRRLPEAIIFALVGGLTLDTMAGWNLPTHTALLVCGVGLFYLFSVRIFSSQTSPSTATNAFLVCFVMGVLQAVFAGFSFVSLPDQSFSLSGVWTSVILRSLIVAISLGALQMLRRRSYVQVEGLRS